MPLLVKQVEDLRDMGFVLFLLMRHIDFVERIEERREEEFGGYGDHHCFPIFLVFRTVEEGTI